MGTKPKKERIKKRTLFTLVAMFNITWYTIGALVLTYFDHSVPSDLTVAWFAAWTTELALLYGIKKSENIEPEDNIEEVKKVIKSTIEDTTKEINQQKETVVENVIKEEPSIVENEEDYFDYGMDEDQVNQDLMNINFDDFPAIQTPFEENGED